jgi:predicted transcriptional regulator
MAIMWAGEPMSVRQVITKLKKNRAHTTVMTTLDRLYKKGLLARDRDGTAYVYRPAMSRDEFHCKLVEETVGGLLEQSTGAVLAALVDTAAELDEDNLKKLEALIAKRRGRK